MARLITRGLPLLALIALLWAPTAARADKVYGAVILNEARKIGPGRYQSMKNYERTLRFFRRAYGNSKGIVTRRIAGTPKVKGVHIANLARNRTWDGINVYKTGSKVFIYVIKAGSGSSNKK